MHCGPMQTTICRHMRAVAVLCLCRLLPHADIICSFRPKNNAHNTANFGKHAILKFAALHGTVAHHSTICRICAKHMGSHMSLVPLSQSLLNGSWAMKASRDCNYLRDVGYSFFFKFCFFNLAVMGFHATCFAHLQSSYARICRLVAIRATTLRTKRQLCPQKLSLVGKAVLWTTSVPHGDGSRWLFSSLLMLCHCYYCVLHVLRHVVHGNWCIKAMCSTVLCCNSFVLCNSVCADRSGMASPRLLEWYFVCSRVLRFCLWFASLCWQIALELLHHGCDLNVICTKHCVFRVNRASVAEKSWLAWATIAGDFSLTSNLSRTARAVELMVPGDFSLFGWCCAFCVLHVLRHGVHGNWCIEAMYSTVLCCNSFVLCNSVCADRSGMASPRLLEWYLFCSTVEPCHSVCGLQVSVGRSHWNCYIMDAIWMLGFARNIVFSRVNRASVAEKSWLACATVAGRRCFAVESVSNCACSGTDGSRWLFLFFVDAVLLCFACVATRCALELVYRSDVFHSSVLQFLCVVQSSLCR